MTAWECHQRVLACVEMTSAVERDRSPDLVWLYLFIAVLVSWLILDIGLSVVRNINPSAGAPRPLRPRRDHERHIRHSGIRHR